MVFDSVVNLLSSWHFLLHWPLCCPLSWYFSYFSHSSIWNSSTGSFSQFRGLSIGLLSFPKGIHWLCTSRLHPKLYCLLISDPEFSTAFCAFLPGWPTGNLKSVTNWIICFAFPTLALLLLCSITIFSAIQAYHIRVLTPLVPHSQSVTNAPLAFSSSIPTVLTYCKPSLFLCGPLEWLLVWPATSYPYCQISLHGTFIENSPGYGAPLPKTLYRLPSAWIHTIQPGIQGPPCCGSNSPWT